MAEPFGVLLLSGTHDRAHYAFVLATGAAALGRTVVLFATNRGLHALMRDWSGLDDAGRDGTIQARGVAGLDTLREAAAELGIVPIACEAGLHAEAIDAAKLLPGVRVAGVATFLAEVGAAPSSPAKGLDGPGRPTQGGTMLRTALLAALLAPAVATAQPAPAQTPPHRPAHHSAAPAPHPVKPAAKPVAKPAPAPKPATPAPAPAAPPPAEPTKGSNTGLPLPRFASLKTDEVNLRTGPGLRYPIDWVYKRRDLPVQIEREFEVWRLIADEEGVKGWVHQATLVGRRTFVVTGTERTVRADANDAAAPVVRIKPGVIGRIRACEATASWCQVQVGDYRGWLKRDAFWGIYGGEAIQ